MENNKNWEWEEFRFQQLDILQLEKRGEMREKMKERSPSNGHCQTLTHFPKSEIMYDFF